MAVRFQDYYELLGVSRTATPDEIHRAYRKLARKFHPDVNRSKDAEDKFKKIGEAYEVLKSPEKRQRYDTLGADWKAGQEFSPPPEWFRQGAGGPRPGAGRRPGRPPRGAPEDMGGFSEFFDLLFGQQGGQGGQGGFGRRGGPTAGPPGYEEMQFPEGGQDTESEIAITVEDACHGAEKELRLEGTDLDERGAPRRVARTYRVRIPPGTTTGSTIRLAGQGGRGRGGGTAGDLLLHVTIAPHPRYRLDGHDLLCTVAISPWEAALGTRLNLPTVDGEAQISIPPGTQSGRVLRLRGKGLPQTRGLERGDLLVDIAIRVPDTLTADERALFERLAQVSRFNPRSGG